MAQYFLLDAIAANKSRYEIIENTYITVDLHKKVVLDHSDLLDSVKYVLLDAESLSLVFVSFNEIMQLLFNDVYLHSYNKHQINVSSPDYYRIKFKITNPQLGDKFRCVEYMDYECIHGNPHFIEQVLKYSFILDSLSQSQSFHWNLFGQRFLSNYSISLDKEVDTKVKEILFYVNKGIVGSIDAKDPTRFKDFHARIKFHPWRKTEEIGEVATADLNSVSAYLALLYFFKGGVNNFFGLSYENNRFTVDAIMSRAVFEVDPAIKKNFITMQLFNKEA